ncbi:MAG: hypothetical protein HC767_05735 [Akkermansiaceae bacterium]|nr:hypothetical protein [Akkermansiaceae bacterium]
MNTILPFLHKLQQVLEARFPEFFRHKSTRRSRIVVQLEFPWELKR